MSRPTAPVLNLRNEERKGGPSTTLSRIKRSTVQRGINGGNNGDIYVDNSKLIDRLKSFSLHKPNLSSNPSLRLDIHNLVNHVYEAKKSDFEFSKQLSKQKNQNLQYNNIYDKQRSSRPKGNYNDKFDKNSRNRCK
jgi:hypothetical protein